MKITLEKIILALVIVNIYPLLSIYALISFNHSFDSLLDIPISSAYWMGWELNLSVGLLYFISRLIIKHFSEE